MKNVLTATVLTAAMVMNGCSVQVRADRSDSSVSLLHPKSSEIVRCELGPDRIYRFAVIGAAPGLSKDQTIMLWVQPLDPPSETTGWYLQRGYNGITKFDRTTGDWEGVGQIGNPAWPPHSGDTLNVAVTAVDAREAERLLAERGVVTRRTLPGTVSDIARKVRVGM